MNISIHAPPRGATEDFGAFISMILFQFTPLREGRRLVHVSNITLLHISIHAPPRGATGTRPIYSTTENISIHAPPRGATIPTAYVEGRKQFQFTPLREGRPRLLSKN